LIAPAHRIRGKFQQNGAVVRAVPDQVSIAISRKSSLPFFSGKVSVMSGRDVVLVFLSVSPSINVTTEAQVLQITIIDSVSKEVNDVRVHSITPPLLLIIKDNIKISKNEPLLVLVVTSQIIYEIASKKLVLDLGEPINSSSTPKNIIISNMHINVVKMLIHNSQINVTRVPK
jgi:hypothetical protein